MVAIVPGRRKRITDIHLVDASKQVTPLFLSDQIAERAVIGSVFYNPELYPALANIVQPGDFSEKFNAFIWWACEQAYPAINNVSIIDIIKAHIPDTANANMRINDMVASVSDVNQAESYAHIVRERARLIRMFNATEDMRSTIFNKELSAEEIIDHCNRILFDASEQRIGEPDTTAKALIDDLWTDLENADRQEGAPGIRIGIPGFDAMFHRLYAGEVSMLVGHTGMGKTTLLLSMVHDAIRRNPGKRIAFFSLEQSKREIITILSAMETGLHKALFLEKKFNREQWERFIASAPDIAAWKLDVIDEFPSLTVTQLRRKLRFLFREAPVDLVVIDGLWLMDMDEKGEERHRDLHYITKDLTKIAKDEFGIPILISHQYNRNARIRQDKRPEISDVAESSSISFNLHLILAMYRESYFNRDTDDNTTRLYVLKDRIRGNGGRYIDLRYELGKFKGNPL